MFSIDSVYTKSSTIVKVDYNGETLKFVISSIIAKRNKDELDDNNQYKLVNSYLDYKGEEFKKELFNRLIKSYNDITDSILLPDIYPLPVYIVNGILDMFSLDDIIYYVKNVFKLPAPANLEDEFDYNIEKDGKGTRIQTYIKDDYIELVALVVVIKIIIGSIGYFAYARAKDVNTVHKEYILYQLLKQHPIFKSNPANKLWGLIDKVVNLPTNDQKVDNIRTLEKQLPKEEIATAILAVVAIQKLSVCCIVDDDKDKNIVTKVYNYVNNKLKSAGDTTKSIKPKTSLTDTESGTGDKESIIESTRISSNLNTATPLELSWAINSVEKILIQLPEYIKSKVDMEVVNDAMEFNKIFNNGNIHRVQIDILAFIFKDIIDPRALDYVDIDSIINLMSVGFAYLWGIDFKKLALLLVSQQNTMDEDIMSINSTVNRTRIPKEVKEELEVLYPYKRVINKETQANLVEETINGMVNDFFDKKWNHTASDKYILSVLNNTNSNNLLYIDLKLDLANFIIQHERNR